MTDDKYQQAMRNARLRMYSIREALNAYVEDSDTDAVHGMPLDVEVLGNIARDKYHVTVLLGTGGPHDELRYVVSDGSVDSVTYWYADWGYGTEVPLAR